MRVSALLAAYSAVLLVASSSAEADGFKITDGHPFVPGGVGGAVFESSTFKANRNVIFDIYLTGSSGSQIDGRFASVKAASGATVQVNIPGAFRGFQVFDVHNVTRYVTPPDDNEVADLSIEAFNIDPTTNTVEIEGLFGRLQTLMATQPVIQIPDLYADTNGDGTLDEGDLLYSLVDVNQYVAAMPTFALGDTFSIVNGEVAGLQGMLFSTTPFVFDPSSPFGEDFTPYTGIGVAESEHAFIPEPSALVLVGTGLVGLLGFGRRRNKSNP